MVALPLVRATCTAVFDAYSAAKDRYPLLGSACRLAEHCVCGLTTRALDHAQPLLSRLQPQLATVNHLACRGLDKLEEKLPFLQQPSEMVPAQAPPDHRGLQASGGGRERCCFLPDRPGHQGQSQALTQNTSARLK